VQTALSQQEQALVALRTAQRVAEQDASSSANANANANASAASLSASLSQVLGLESEKRPASAAVTPSTADSAALEALKQVIRTRGVYQDHLA
jgi:hypothetical protein